MTLSPLSGSLGPLGVPRRAAAFTPDQLTGLQLWLEADAIAGKLDGDPIGTGDWADASGNGRNPTATGTQRPAYRTGIVGGKPVIRFDGVTNQLSIASFPGSTTRTLFAVAASRDVTKWVPIAPHNANGGISFGWNGPLNPTKVYLVNSGVAVLALSAATFANNQFRLIVGKFSGTGNVLYLNGTQDATNAGTVGGTAGNTMWLGWHGDVSYRGPLDLAALLVWNSALSDADRQSVESYLNAKYSLY